MSIPISEIKTALIAFIEASTGIANNKIVRGYSNNPEPEGDFIRFIPALSVTGSAMPGEIKYLSDGTIELIHDRDILCQIAYYGENAISIISGAYDAIEHPVYSDIFGSIGLSVMRASGIRDLTGLKGPVYEAQANFDLKILTRYTNEIIDDLGWFNKVEVSGAGDLAGRIYKIIDLEE